jgi:hypothetical protein
MANATVRQVQRVTNKPGHWLIMANGKKIGDIARGRKDFRVYFYHSGFAFYRKTEKEALETALRSEDFVAKPKVLKAAEPKAAKGKATKMKPAKQAALPFQPTRTAWPTLPPMEPVRAGLLQTAAHAMTLPIIYAAYGANTCRTSMASRCPTAQPVGRGIIPGWRLEFKGCADIIQQPGANLEVAVWLIYPNDEAALDRFEGYPAGYVKRYLPVSIIVDPNEPHTWVHTRAMVYVMTDRRRCRAILPNDSYRQVLERGYNEFGLRPEQITEALAAARNDEPLTASRATQADGNWYDGNWRYSGE